METIFLKLLTRNGCKRICHKHYDFLALVGFHKSFLIADSIDKCHRKDWRSFSFSQWSLFLKGRNIQPNFQGERAVSEPNLPRSWKTIWRKESCHWILCTCTHSLPPLYIYTHLNCPVLYKPDQYFRHKWGELKGREIHIEVWKHSRKKKTDLFKRTNTPNKSWWAWWGDCSSSGSFVITLSAEQQLSLEIDTIYARQL